MYLVNILVYNIIWWLCKVCSRLSQLTSAGLQPSTGFPLLPPPAPADWRLVVTSAPGTTSLSLCLGVSRRTWTQSDWALLSQHQTPANLCQVGRPVLRSLTVDRRTVSQTFSGNGSMLDWLVHWLVTHSLSLVIIFKVPSGQQIVNRGRTQHQITNSWLEIKVRRSENRWSHHFVSLLCTLTIHHKPINT